jgi:hypothetical protein
MKKLFPDASDVPQSVANRAARIVEKHLRTQRVNRARDLSEEARIRLYRDLRLLFEGGERPDIKGNEGQGFSVRRFCRRLWEGLEDFLSASMAERTSRQAATPAVAASQPA